jgi:hypothetical protein
MYGPTVIMIEKSFMFGPLVVNGKFGDNMKKNKGWPEAIVEIVGYIIFGWIILSIISCARNSWGETSITKFGTKAWCTVNTQWQVTECLYDTKAECQRCAFVDGEDGLQVKEYCGPNMEK